uniref:hypothetical protein n=1 Tax=Anaerophaga thermohalophila TaxID=177400 RepID=UPI0005C63303
MKRFVLFFIFTLFFGFSLISQNGNGKEKKNSNNGVYNYIDVSVQETLTASQEYTDVAKMEAITEARVLSDAAREAAIMKATELS